MRNFGLVCVLALAACTSAPSSMPAANVTCAAPTVTQVMQSDGSCKIDFGSCSDGSSYDLRCRNLNLGGVDDEGIDCLCDIDGVTPSELDGDVGVSDTTCTGASSIMSSRWQRAWLECNVNMTIK